MADDCAPAHIRDQPAYVTELLAEAKSRFKHTITSKIKSIVDKKGDFVIQMPIWVSGLTILDAQTPFGRQSQVQIPSQTL